MCPLIITWHGELSAEFVRELRKARHWVKTLTPGGQGMALKWRSISSAWIVPTVRLDFFFADLGQYWHLGNAIRDLWWMVTQGFRNKNKPNKYQMYARTYDSRKLRQLIYIGPSLSWCMLFMKILNLCISLAYTSWGKYCIKIYDLLNRLWTRTHPARGREKSHLDRDNLFI